MKKFTRIEKCSINTTVIDLVHFSNMFHEVYSCCCIEQLLHATLLPALEEVLPGYKGTRDKSLRCVGIVRFIVALRPPPTCPYRWVSSSSGWSSFDRWSKGTIQLSLNSPFSTIFFSSISGCTSITSSVGLSW